MTAIADQLGWDTSGGPEAELWLGAHAGSPSRILRPDLASGATNLEEWISAHPEDALGESGHRLSFLMKLLAAGSPLSLQAHPTAAQARSGFQRENEAGVPLTAAHRNYKDEYPKPELIFALSATFDALCGFRRIAEFSAIVEQLGALAPEAEQVVLRDLSRRATGSEPLRTTVSWLLQGGPDVERLVRVVSALGAHPAAVGIPGMIVVRTLARAYPGDAGIVVSLLLNHVTLKRGEVLYLPAGNIHAYVEGLGIEVMASSDNVLRGGLTPKHVDVPELMSVLDFREQPVPYLAPTHAAPGLDVFTPDVDDFRLVHYDGRNEDAGGSWLLNGPAIAICTEGIATLTGADSGTFGIARGESVYITPRETFVSFSGPGEVFLATTGGV